MRFVISIRNKPGGGDYCSVSVSSGNARRWPPTPLQPGRLHHKSLLGASSLLVVHASRVHAYHPKAEG
jgi:hypothetical protein